MGVRQRSTFISYRREGGADVARTIEAFLQLNGFRVFLDVDSLGAGHFDAQLLSHIERCDYFLLICSPGCLDRCANEQDWVRREIAHALTNRRQIVPIMLPGFRWPAAESLPAEIAEVTSHNAFEYSHSHWKRTSERLLEMLGAAARPDGVSVDDRLLIAVAREFNSSIDHLAGSERAEEIRVFLDRTRTLPASTELRREIVCLRATRAIELNDAALLGQSIEELQHPQLLATATEEQLKLIAQATRLESRGSRNLDSGPMGLFRSVGRSVGSIFGHRTTAKRPRSTKPSEIAPSHRPSQQPPIAPHALKQDGPIASPSATQADAESIARPPSTVLSLARAQPLLYATLLLIMATLGMMLASMLLSLSGVPPRHIVLLLGLPGAGFSACALLLAVIAAGSAFTMPRRWAALWYAGAVSVLSLIVAGIWVLAVLVQFITPTV